jgi:hypothetical protein
MWVNFTSYPSGKSVVIQDNTYGDLETLKGVITLAAKKDEWYVGCIDRATPKWAYETSNPTYPYCRMVETSKGSVNLGIVYARKRPWISWYTKDDFNNLIWPATLELTWPDRLRVRDQGAVQVRGDDQQVRNRRISIDSEPNSSLASLSGEP